MKLEIIEVTTIYPLVHVIEKGSFDLNTLSANVICTVDISIAEKMIAYN